MSAEKHAKENRRARTGGARLTRLPGGRPHVTKVLMSEDEHQVVAARAEAVGVSIPRLLVEAATDDGPPTATERKAVYAELLALRRAVAHMDATLAQLLDAASPDHASAATELEKLTVRLAAVLDRLDTATTRLFDHRQPATRPKDTR